MNNGPAGPQGLPGKDGTGVSILGAYNTLEELQNAHPTGNVGDAYMVDRNLYVWNSENWNWLNVGNIKGPKGDIGPQGEQGPKGEDAVVEIITDAEIDEIIDYEEV